MLYNYIPFAIAAFIITAIIVARANSTRQKKLQGILDKQDNEPKIILSSFNKKDERKTTFSVKNGSLVIETDLQVIQLKEDGILQLKFSSKYEDKEIRGEMWTVIDPSLLMLSAIDYKSNQARLVVPYRDERTEQLLRVLLDEFDIKYNIKMDLPATSVEVLDVKIGRSSKEFTIYGEFKDQGKWKVDVNYEQFTLIITASLSSLQTTSNFQKFYYS